MTIIRKEALQHDVCNRLFQKKLFLLQPQFSAWAFGWAKLGFILNFEFLDQ